LIDNIYSGFWAKKSFALDAKDDGKIYMNRAKASYEAFSAVLLFSPEKNQTIRN